MLRSSHHLSYSHRLFSIIKPTAFLLSSSLKNNMGNQNQSTSTSNSASNNNNNPTSSFYKPGEKSHFKPHLQGTLLPPLEKCQFRFQLLSDIHLEFRVPQDISERKSITEYFRFDADEVLAENLVLAGDIGLCCEEMKMIDVLEEFLVYCCSIFKRVFFLHGNHEFYHTSLEDADARMKALALDKKKLPRQNFIYMNKTTYDVHGTDVRILGCTLWSKPTLEGASILNDFKKIQNFSYDTMLQLHDDHVRWLLSECARAQEEKKRVLIITHHSPCKLLGTTPEENYEWESKNGICGTGLVPQVFSKEKTPAVDLMIFGHTHWSCSFEAGGIGIAANQVGYPHDKLFKNFPTYVEYNKKRVYGI